MPLVFLFVLLPALELALLIEIGSRIGSVRTLGLIIVTGMVGASLARRQGMEVLRRVQEATARGLMPAEPMVDGILILVAGALLVTPGIVTDITGFLILIPATRALLKRFVLAWFERQVKSGRAHVHVHPMQDFDAPPGHGPVFDITPTPSDSPGTTDSPPTPRNEGNP